jgi:cholinesterase
LTALGGLVSKGNQKEDCLYMNVWARPQTGESSKAVLLWIFGGGFNLGDASLGLYDGSHLVDQHDVVVVSFNYRTNLFGFPAAPGFEYQNPGLMDQRLAIEWVRDNIAAFGGDPARITIFGESAGASSVDYYAYSYPKDPIVHGFISESGTAEITGPFARSSPADRATRWYALSSKLGCGGAEAGNSTIPCVQGKTTKDVLGAMTTKSGLNLVTGDFGPTVDGKIVFDDYLARSRAGNFAQKVYNVSSTLWCDLY